MVGITAQMLALVRTLAEYLRLRWVEGPAFTADTGAVWVTGALVDAVLLLVAVELFFFRRYTAVIVVALLTVAVLLLYKGLAIGF